MWDALIRLAQPLNLFALPVLIWQGRQVRRRMPRLPVAAGPLTGSVPGAEPVLRLTILGDSAAAGVGAGTHEETLAGNLARELAQRTGREVSWQVIAASGATTADVIGDLVPLLTEQAGIVITVVGVNDLKDYRPIPSFRRDIRTIVKAIRDRAGHVPIVLAGVPPFQHMPGLPRPTRNILGLRGRALADVQCQVAAQVEDVLCIRLHHLALPPEAFTEDGFHPSGEGYRRWATVIGQALADAPAMLAAGAS